MFVLFPFSAAAFSYFIYFAAYILVCWIMADFLGFYFYARENGLPKPYFAFIYLNVLARFPESYRFR